ncbi:MAG TPA: MFS transporter, partial [Thermovirga lienii]|nr:MFS transporter [Thermovirga lienii]
MASSVEKTRKRTVLKDETLYMVFAVTLLSVLGVASVTPAFPQIAKFFGISPAKTGLVVSSFTIPGLVATPLLGLLADRYGRKKVLVPCLFLFGLSGGMCALSRSFNELLMMRVLQGIGASALNSLNITIIGDLYREKYRTEAMGY